MAKHNYKFYMQKVNKDGTAIEGEEAKDLEKDFNGLKYSKAEGIEEVGEVKNIYEESYSDSDSLRVYIPDTIYNEPTTITLTLFFVGDGRFKVRDEFNEYIVGGFRKYWDNSRKKWFIFYVKDNLPIEESMWYGSTPYLKCKYKLINIYGKSFNIE